MEKKYFDQPILKVVQIKKNIIATSDPMLHSQMATQDDAENQFVGERRGWDSF